MRAALTLCALLTCGASGATAQDGAPDPAPPAEGIIAEPVAFSLGIGLATLDWDADAPFDDTTLWSLAVDRRLGPLVRARAMLGLGSTDLALEGPVETRLYIIDLQVLVGPDLGLVTPYAIGGVGAVVTAPDEPAGVDLPTRSQSQITFGGGVRARVTARIDVSGEFTSAAFRLADAFDAEERETDTVHNSRWEGRVSWLF